MYAKRLRVAIIVLALISLAALQANAWRGRDHVHISGLATELVPDDMAAWRNYTELLKNLSYQPDLWKGVDEREGPRHYIDIELYGVDTAQLSRERPDDPGAGIAPWVIIETTARMSGAMRDGEWTNAVRFAGALGHYVADLHQPLHCTENFDGRETGNDGIHLRWESEMPTRIGPRTRPHEAMPADYLAHPWTNILAWAQASHELVPHILEADDTAMRTTGYDIESDDYYRTLWAESGDVFVSQSALAATHLGSLWYTAWIDAGRPPIPRPPLTITTASIHPLPPRTWIPQYGSWGVLLVISAGGILIILLSVVRYHREKQAKAAARLKARSAEE